MVFKIPDSELQDDRLDKYHRPTRSPEPQEQLAPGRRPVERYRNQHAGYKPKADELPIQTAGRGLTSSTNHEPDNQRDESYRSVDPAAVMAVIVSDLFKLILVLLIVAGLGIYVYHWYASEDIGHESLTSLQQMPCSKFDSLSLGDQQTVANRMFFASGYSSEGEINNTELGGGNELLNLQYTCQTNPSGTIAQ